MRARVGPPRVGPPGPFRSGGPAGSRRRRPLRGHDLLDAPSPAAQGPGRHDGRVSDAITPFRIEVPESDLEDLRQRLRLTRWPEPATVAGWSQGIPLDYTRE